MKTITNLLQLEQPNGMPYLLQQPEANPADSASPKMVAAAAPLTTWLSVLVGNLPWQRFPFVDSVKGAAILTACSKTQTGGTIELDDDHYAWLLKVLYDDGEGKRLNPEVECCYAVQAIGLVAVAVRQALD